MLELPPGFAERMKAQLGGDESQAFLDSLQRERTYGLRVQSGRLLEHGQAPMLKLAERFGLRPVPWCQDGYYYDPDSRPGRHPYHAAGLYYIQEPSAMSAAELLDPRPGDTVLDLAAAPGGKSVQLAARLKGQGLLVSNEIHPVRVRILSENIERLGIANCVVTNMAPDPLAEAFPGFFDKIMVDAPCSGEGMFRKDPDAVREWSENHVALCAARQQDILRAAARMLKPGGRLAYSTCTFNREENEGAIGAFVNAHPAFELEREERIWPHRQDGEGHYVAVLRHRAEAGSPSEAAGRRSRRDGRAVPGKGRPDRGGRGSRQEQGPLREAMQQFSGQAAELLPGFRLGPGEPLLFGDQLYWLPDSGGFHPGLLRGVKVQRPGLHLGARRPGRLEPAHAVLLAAGPGCLGEAADFGPDDPEVRAYLAGEALPTAGQRSGWLAVAVDGCPLGWGKASAGQIKNHYPKGLRRLN